MRRRDLDELTGREREVLALLRRDFTNEQIAQRLDISLAGAKYHVSQILSKLGVATREEAAAIALGEPRRWWVGWGLWAKIAGAATVAVAVGGLAWGVIQTDPTNDELGPDRPTDVRVVGFSIEWSDTSEDESGFRIYLDCDGRVSKAFEAERNSTRFDVFQNPCPSGIFGVAAFNSGGESEISWSSSAGPVTSTTT